ncbi:MAG: hypothetical protein EA398_12455 [Deltaproteobacteria bacterium]|nr:MAG: hypothetical protein EA398_12455 [Deltaproteobacteria bacterium]
MVFAFPRRWPLALCALVLMALASGGCQPDIGDSCRTSQNCRSGHLCDRSIPGAGGYCTILDCREGECPGGSVCVIFEEGVSACLAKCDRNRDCRPDDGIVCRRDVGDTPFCYAPPADDPAPPAEDPEPSAAD